MTSIPLISEDQLEETLLRSLNNITKNEGFVNHEKIVRAISTNGGNYVGELFEVVIKGNTKDGDKEINLFIKQINQGSLDNIPTVKKYQDSEIFAYSELATMYTQLMNDANIPDAERFKQAKCYDTNDMFIILENLAAKGYETLERTTPLTFRFAELAIKQLAKFHALSFVLQDKNPDYLNEDFKQLQCPLTSKSDRHKTLLKNLTDIVCGLLDENSEKRLRAHYEKISNLNMYCEESPKCLCHGDFRANNMLIRKENGIITDLIPVDYQIIHFGNPLIDFWYLLIPHSDREFRRKHLTTLKELYYDTLTQFLKYFDIDVSNVYPRKQFEDDYKVTTGFGLSSAILLSIFLFAREDAIPDVGNIAALKSQVKLQDCAKERIQGIIDDYMEWGVI